MRTAPKLRVLVDAAAATRAAQDAADRARERLNMLIREAASGADALSGRVIADAVGLSAQRVSQILRGGRV